ncbi:MAG: preprotein translocase subunit SecE [Oscillospiraceae bacterium]|nr:preprotein translocase subunit SecE [Oscillospiraceae bacterium]
MATAEKKKWTERLADWFRGMKSELKKVVWPTPKQVTNNSLVVIFMVAVSGIVLGGIDLLAGQLIRLLINLFGA